MIVDMKTAPRVFVKIKGQTYMLNQQQIACIKHMVMVKCCGIDRLSRFNVDINSLPGIKTTKCGHVFDHPDQYAGFVRFHAFGYPPTYEIAYCAHKTAATVLKKIERVLK